MSCCDVKHSKQHSKAIAQETSQFVYFESFSVRRDMRGGNILIVVLFKNGMRLIVARTNSDRDEGCAS